MKQHLIYYHGGSYTFSGQIRDLDGDRVSHPLSDSNLALSVMSSDLCDFVFCKN